MGKYYITFGQVHVHSISGKTFDKDCLAEIEAESYSKAREIAMDIFKGAFHHCFAEETIAIVLAYYPRGIIKVNNK